MPYYRLPKTDVRIFSPIERPDLEEVPAPDADETPGISPESLIKGTVGQILERVGGDAEKAAEALEAELGADRPRSTLVAALSELVEGDGGTDEEEDA